MTCFTVFGVLTGPMVLHCSLKWLMNNGQKSQINKKSAGNSNLALCWQPANKKKTFFLAWNWRWVGLYIFVEGTWTKYIKGQGGGGRGGNNNIRVLVPFVTSQIVTSRCLEDGSTRSQRWTRCQLISSLWFLSLDPICFIGDGGEIKSESEPQWTAAPVSVPAV